MTTYRRPAINAPVFHDADGRVIEYGSRWPGSPPDDTYSVESNLQRFAPLHTVADALIDHLVTTYDVQVDDDIDPAVDLLRPSVTDLHRAVRLRPADPTCAGMTVVFTDYPGVAVHAGVLHDFVFPGCGCDACDRTWEAEADDLERLVLGVADGRYREAVALGDRPWLEHALGSPDGTSSSGSLADGIPAGRLEAAAGTLQRLPDGWAPWPRLTGSA